MDFESMMYTPAVYRDIPSSFMYNSMMPIMPMMPAYGMMPCAYSPLAQLPNDKFVKLQEKEKETKNTVFNTLAGLGVFLISGLLLGKLSKKIGIPKRLNLNNNNLINRAKNAFSNSISKVKKFFKVSS